MLKQLAAKVRSRAQVALAAVAWVLVAGGPAAAASAQRIESGPCSVESFKVLAGRAEASKLHLGLHAVTRHLAALVNTAHRTQPGLNGTLAVTLHVEGNGKLRMLLEGARKLEHDTSPDLMAQLVGELMQRRDLFPPIGEDILIEIHLAVRPAR